MATKSPLELTAPGGAVFRIPLDKVRYDNERQMIDALERNLGVRKVEINPLEGLLIVYYDKAFIGQKDISRALASPDYKIKFGAMRKLIGTLRKNNVIIRFFMTVALLAVSTWLFYGGKNTHGESFLPTYYLLNGLIILLAIPAFIRGLSNAFKKARVTIDFVVLVIVIIAMAVGQWLEASFAVFVALIGEALEIEAARRAQRGLSIGTVMEARTATVKKGDDVQDIPINKVQKGDVVLVKQGMVVPVDGVVVSGRAEVRQSELTGESIYRTYQEGYHVFAGGMVSTGSIEVEAEKVGAETALAGIDRLVLQAARTQSPFERRMDKVAAAFLGIMLVVFAVYFIVFGQGQALGEQQSTLQVLQRGTTIMISICPFALLLATPVGMYVGIITSARRGRIFKNGLVMEKMAQVKVMLMDKTGTLTYGRTEVSGIKTFGAATELEVAAAAVFVEQNSSHPIAKAICHYGRKLGAKVEEADQFLEFEGAGAAAMRKGKQIKVGSLRFIDDGREIPTEVEDWATEQAKKGRAIALVADMHEILGGLIFEDEVRADAPETIQKLRNAGLKKIILVTGDNSEIARRVEKALGLDKGVANCLPETKMKLIANTKRSGFTVAMVGDGINDAPALAAADIGIAMGAMGSDAAVEAADVALLRDDLEDIWRAFMDSRRVLNVIRINIILTLIANIALGVFAFTGNINFLQGAGLQIVLMGFVTLTSLSLIFRKE